MKPTTFYISSAAIYSFLIAAFIGYPAAAISSLPGYSPDMKLWFWFIALFGFALTVYSAIPKPEPLLAVNWLVISGLAAVTYGASWLINPAPVEQNSLMALRFSLYTFGGPIWPLLIAFFVHMVACTYIGSEKNA